MARQKTEQSERKGRGQRQPGRGSSEPGRSARQRSTEDLKREARNAEAEEQKGHTNGATHMPEPGREMAEQFADQSRQQIDRYERAFGEFWKVAESDGFVPLTKGVARTNMELAGLASRRAKAYVEFPAELTRCQTPQDVVNRHMRFWSDMMRDYQTTLGRMTRTWADSASPQQLQQMMQEAGERMREGMASASIGLGGRRRAGGERSGEQ